MSIHYTVLAISLMKAIKGLLLHLFHLSVITLGAEIIVSRSFYTFCFPGDFDIMSSSWVFSTLEFQGL